MDTTMARTTNLTGIKAAPLSPHVTHKTRLPILFMNQLLISFVDTSLHCRGNHFM